eukprot:11212521-Lingulodinium_polyedra.AAC.1
MRRGQTPTTRRTAPGPGHPQNNAFRHAPERQTPARTRRAGDICAWPGYYGGRLAHSAKDENMSPLPG